MKKTLLFLLLFSAVITLFAQAKPDTVKQDTVIQVSFEPSEYNAFLKWLDGLNENHQTIKELQTFFYRRARLVGVPKTSPTTKPIP